MRFPGDSGQQCSSTGCQVSTVLNVTSITRKLPRKDNFSKSILLVEDEAETAKALFRPLFSEGYLVRLVLSRADALDAICQDLYQIVIIEYFMSGPALEDFLKELKLLSHKSCFVLIGEAYLAEAKAAELGLRHWIAKPFCDKDVIDVFSKIG